MREERGRELTGTSEDVEGHLREAPPLPTLLALDAPPSKSVHGGSVLKHEVAVDEVGKKVVG